MRYRHTLSSHDLARQLTDMRSSLRELRDRQVGLQRPIHVPHIRALRGKTKTTTTATSRFESAVLQEAGGFLGGDSFYDSASQVASRWLTLMVRAGRIQ